MCVREREGKGDKREENSTRRKGIVLVIYSKVRIATLMISKRTRLVETSNRLATSCSHLF